MDQGQVEPTNQQTNQQPIVVNGWDNDSENTVKQWQSDLLEQSFIYGEQLEGYESYMNVALIIPIVAGAFVTIIAAISAALNTLGVIHWIPFGFDIVVFIFSGTATVCNTLVKVLGWEDTIKQLTKHIGKLDSQWAVFETEMTTPQYQRLNGPDFIRKENGNYMHLQQQAPHISPKDYYAAKQAYIQRMEDYRKWEEQLLQPLQP